MRCANVVLPLTINNDAPKPLLQRVTVTCALYPYRYATLIGKGMLPIPSPDHPSSNSPFSSVYAFVVWWEVLARGVGAIGSLATVMYLFKTAYKTDTSIRAVVQDHELKSVVVGVPTASSGRSSGVEGGVFVGRCPNKDDVEAENIAQAYLAKLPLTLTFRTSNPKCSLHTLCTANAARLANLGENGFLGIAKAIARNAQVGRKGVAY